LIGKFIHLIINLLYIRISENRFILVSKKIWKEFQHMMNFPCIILRLPIIQKLQWNISKSSVYNLKLNILCCLNLKILLLKKVVSIFWLAIVLWLIFLISARKKVLSQDKKLG